MSIELIMCDRCKFFEMQKNLFNPRIQGICKNQEIKNYYEHYITIFDAKTETCGCSEKIERVNL